MHLHTDTVRVLQAQVLTGDVGPLRAVATELATWPLEPELAPWAIYAAAVRDRAAALASSTTLDAATHQVAMLAASCNGCHLAGGAHVYVPARGPLPAAGGDASANMQRHQWATDELWMAMIAGDPVRWRAALSTLATDRFDLPGLSSKQRDHLDALRMIAAAGLPGDSRLDLASAAASTYGDLLAQCASCHASLASGVTP